MVDQMHCPNSMLVGGLGLKSYQRENSECFDLFLGLRENRVVATVLETFFSTTNGSFKDFLPNAMNFYLCLKSQMF